MPWVVYPNIDLWTLCAREYEPKRLESVVLSVPDYRTSEWLAPFGIFKIGFSTLVQSFILNYLTGKIKNSRKEPAKFPISYLCSTIPENNTPFGSDLWRLWQEEN